MRRRQASSARVQPHCIRQMKLGLGEGCVFRGWTPGPPHLPASTSPDPGLIKSTREAESRNWDGEDSLHSSVLPPSAHRSPYPAWPCCVQRISRLCFHSEALPLAVHMLPSGSRFISFSVARPARKGLNQGRRLARAGRGAGIPEKGRAGWGGGGVHTGDPASDRPPGWRRRGCTGFPHPYPESQPRRSPGALAGRRKCSVTPVSAPIPPHASGLGEPLDSAWDTGASSSRAAGRSLRASAEGPPPNPRNFPLFTWDRQSDLRT